jgi:hypothetical protein
VRSFNLVLSLLSVIYALALTHVLSRAVALVVARDRVRFSGLLALAMANAVLFVYMNWLSLWDLREAKAWDLYMISIQVIFAVSLYAISTFAAPSVGDQPVDMEAYYWRQRLPFYWACLASELISLPANLAYLQTPNAHLFLKENIAVLPMFAPTILALAVPKPWAQWLGGGGLFVMLTVFMVVFTGNLG